MDATGKPKLVEEQNWPFSRSELTAGLRRFLASNSLRVRDITLEHCETVMRSPKGRRRKTLSAGTRRHIALALNRLMQLAVYPLKIRESNPIPRQGFLPHKPAAKALAFLYPSEDAALMACATVPIERRVLWGFQTREGCRLSEAAALQWRDFDFEHGAVNLDDPDLDERERVIAALEQAGWVQAKAARLLNMTPRQIAYRIQTLNIKVRQI